MFEWRLNSDQLLKKPNNNTLNAEADAVRAPVWLMARVVTDLHMHWKFVLSLCWIVSLSASKSNDPLK